MSSDFIENARETYIAANAATLRWMLDRPALRGVFLNTKLNSITLQDYGHDDGARGPDYIYGWIQGRGLEALVRHAEAYAERDESLAAALDARGRRLYIALNGLLQKDGRAYFCYGGNMQPIRFEGGAAVPQTREGDVFTYTDAFVAKGLVAGAARYAPAELPERLDFLARVIGAIDDRRFQMDESIALSEHAAATQKPDFGPRMILLGAAELLTHVAHGERAAFAARFIGRILLDHLDPSGLLANVPGEDACNVGHAIEFAGFAMAWLKAGATSELAATLERILVTSFDRGFVGPGIALSVSIETGAAFNSLCPWWSLPETIRTAALCHAYSKSDDTLRIWQAAHHAFFTHYWRGSPAIAYQTMGKEGPVDFVPATPDLDPGYHTGLSLLAAAEAFR